jgi:2'-5' RNA ligase
MTAPASAAAVAQREATARVFFALWPDSAVRDALYRQGQALHRALGGRLTRADSVHLTLLFLGNVAESRLSALHRIAESVSFAPFSMRIDTAKCWRHNDIAWAGPSQVPSELAQLVALLEERAAEAGFALDRRPHAAHVTLLRTAKCRRFDVEPIDVEWPVSEFVLVRSRLHPEGSRYEVIGRWAATLQLER